MSESFSAVIPNGAARERLDRWLATTLPELSRSRIRAAIEAGQARVNGISVVSPSQTVKPGDHVEFIPPEAVSAGPRPEAIELAIQYEDEDVLVLDKPAGLVVHPGAGTQDGTLVNALLQHCGEALSSVGDPARPGIVHRLDKGTSGLMVVAKSTVACESLIQQFTNRRIVRRYRAFVRGHPVPADGKIARPIGRHPVQRTKMAVRDDGKPAVTHYRTCRRYGLAEGSPVAAELTCRLETGRTHQIRVHMAHLGCPLIGDPVYGRKMKWPRTMPEILAASIERFPRQALHAELLGFVHPASGDNLKFTSPLPDNLEQLQNELEPYAVIGVRSDTGEDD